MKWQQAAASMNAVQLGVPQDAFSQLVGAMCEPRFAAVMLDVVSTDSARDLRRAVAAEFEQCWPVLRKYFGEVRPAAMMISAGLAGPRMKIEIQVTAKRQGAHELRPFAVAAIISR